MFVPFRCVPVPENETCRNIVENYAIDVAQVELNIVIANALRRAASLALANETDIDLTCIAIANGIACIFEFPPCIGTKLLLPCPDACGELLGFLATCYFVIEKYVNDEAVRNHFIDYRCRVAESYYDGYDYTYFDFDVDTRCINISESLDG